MGYFFSIFGMRPQAEVYVVVRSDLNQLSMAYKISPLLLSEAGRPVIAESGYVPYQ